VRLGTTLAADGGVLFAAAPGETDGPDRRGAVYVFERDGDAIEFVTELRPSAGTTDRGFGHALAVRGDVAVVGSHAWPLSSSGSPGRAYVYERVVGAWTLTATLSGTPADDEAGGASGAAHVVRVDGDQLRLTDRLEAPTVVADERFGRSVAIDGDVMAIGSPRHTVTGRPPGSASVLVRPD